MSMNVSYITFPPDVLQLSRLKPKLATSFLKPSLISIDGIPTPHYQSKNLDLPSAPPSFMTLGHTITKS